MTKANIMLVEDEILISQDIKEILQGLGYNVTAVVDNGNDAIQLAKSKKPDLILMDIAIKGSMDGIKTTEEIHKESSIPVIYLTSHIDDHRMQRAKFTEPYGYLIKPFDEKTLHSTIEMALYKHKSDSEKDALKTQVTVLNRNLPLTDNEKNVFYGLVKYPDMNDIELGRILRIKRSTVTAIKNRLLNEEYFTTYRVPNLTFIGCELLTTMCGSVKARSSDKLIKELLNAPEHTNTFLTDKNFFGICISKNFSECKNYHDVFRSSLKKEGILEGLNITYYPLRGDSPENFFDYSKYLYHRLGLKGTYEYEESRAHRRRELTKNEKNILYAFVKFPSMTDTEIAAKTKIPRSSISQARRAFINEGILRTLNIPSITKVRSELITQSHLSFDDVMPENDVRAICDHLKKFSSNIFLISSATELCMMNIYDDFTEYENEKSVLNNFFAENNLKYVADNMFTVQKMNFVSFDIAPLVKKVLEIDTKY